MWALSTSDAPDSVAFCGASKGELGDLRSPWVDVDAVEVVREHEPRHGPRSDEVR